MYKNAFIYLFVFFAALTVLLAQAKKDEANKYYHKWLNETVVYILSPEEKAVFTQLTTSEEKDAFIEQFWLRRDPDPQTAVDEFKEEHYRRIAYANAHFKSGKDGWATDRGRIYIVYGPPTSVERYPTGGVYDRPITEGGGVTTTYPREVWYYNKMPNLGSGIEIEFVDPTGSKEYRLALHETDKDALLFVPGAGNTLFEDQGLESRAGRIRSSMAMRSLGLKGDSFGNPTANPFLKLERYMALTKPPVIQFQDLKTIVESNVYYNNLPFHFRYDTFRYSADKTIHPITIEIANKELIYEASQEGLGRSTVNVYGKVQDLRHRIAYEFEDTIYSEILQGNLFGKSLYQRLIPLLPGRYKINLVLKNVNTNKISKNKIGTLETLLLISPQSLGLTCSTLVLADRITAAAPGEIAPDPFVTSGGLKVYPNVQGRFRVNDAIGIYLELYNAQLDESASTPRVDVSYEIRHSPTGEILRKGNITSNSIALFRDKISIARVWTDLGLPPGQYVLRLNIKDLISEQTVSPEAFFDLDPTQVANSIKND